MPDQEDDIVLHESLTKIREMLDIIDTQLVVLTSVIEIDETLYTECSEHKIKTIVRTFKLIAKVQEKIIKEL